MESGGRELGLLVLAIVVVLALIGISRVLFAEDGPIKDKIEDELDKISATRIVMEGEMPDYSINA